MDEETDMLPKWVILLRQWMKEAEEEVEQEKSLDLRSENRHK